MTQLRRQTLTLVKVFEGIVPHISWFEGIEPHIDNICVKDIDDAKKRVEESYAETEKLKTEYDKMNQETQDMITHLKFARSKIKSVMKWKN